MRPLVECSALLLAVSGVAGQTIVDDIGLTAAWGPLTVLLGQQCGVTACAPVHSGPVRQGETITFGHGSAPLSPYAMAIGLPGSCRSVPGVHGGLLLAPPSVQPLALGLTGHEPFVPTPCRQGLAVVVLPVPAGVPVGLTFRVQGLGVSRAGPIAMGPTLEFTVQ